MSKINEKLGLKRPGKRSMMKLPDDRVTRAQLTAALCPACHYRGANLSRLQPGAFNCTWCSHTWFPEATE